MNVPTPNLHSNLQTSLSAGDIVSFRFPFPSTHDCRTRVVRPCLVLDLEAYLGGTFVELLPGTEALLPEPEPSDIWLNETAFFSDDQDAAVVRFIAALHDRFDATHPGFAVPHGALPRRVGRAHGSTLDMIDHLRGQLQATRELHIAERRARRALRRAR